MHSIILYATTTTLIYCMSSGWVGFSTQLQLACKACKCT